MLGVKIIHTDNRSYISRSQGQIYLARYIYPYSSIHIYHKPNCAWGRYIINSISSLYIYVVNEFRVGHIDNMRGLLFNPPFLMHNFFRTFIRKTFIWNLSLENFYMKTFMKMCVRQIAILRQWSPHMLPALITQRLTYSLLFLRTPI